MELEIFNDITKENKIDVEVNNFIKELEKEIDKKETNEIIENIKIDENSELSFVNNIAKNNKMTNKNREELFLQERLSIFDIWNNDKKSGELYYLVGNGVDNDFYAFRVNKDMHSERFQIVKKSELPENAKLGEIYRKKKSGEFYFCKDETREHERKMKLVAKDILNQQEKEGGYKREFTKKDLILGNGYEGEYFEYPLYVDEELGKKAGLPSTMINNFLQEDINKIFENVAKTLSEGDTIYTTLPSDRYTLYEFSKGKMKETDLGNGIDIDGIIFKNNKSGELVEDKKATKLFRENILDELEATVKAKYDKICEDYKKEGHIYSVEKALDENFVPTITLNDISENRFLELEDLDFIENRFHGEGIYTVKNGEYYKINPNEKIPKNHTIDKEKEDNRNFANIMAKKYNLSKDDVEEKMKEFLTETSKEEGVIVYTGYDKKKDEYYIDYYMEGSFDEREIISKEEADELEVGTFATMGRDEFDNYSGFFDAYELRNTLEDIIKNFD